MRNNTSKAIRAAWARGFVPLFAVLAMGLAFGARPAEAAPFAYVTDDSMSTVSVIDTGATPPSWWPRSRRGLPPWGRRHPGRKTRLCRESRLRHCLGDRHGNQHSGGDGPRGNVPILIAVAPDGKHVYVVSSANADPGTVSVIDTATNTVMADTDPGGGVPHTDSRRPGWETRLCGE